MYVCPSCLGMLIFCILHVPTILELDSTYTVALLLQLLVAGHIKLHEHEYNENNRWQHEIYMFVR